jgi:hypothetical protein
MVVPSSAKTKRYIALIDLEFGFDPYHEVALFRELWKEGYSIYSMATYFQRDPDEMLVLYIDQVRRGLISERPGGLGGTKIWRYRNEAHS